MPNALFALLLVSLAANGWLVWHVWRPVRRLSAGAVRLAEGELGTLEHPCNGVSEIESLRRAMLAMAGHVQRAQAQSHAYAGALVRGQESERQRLAHELHDDTVQALVALGQSIDLARAALHTQPAAVSEMLSSTRTMTAQTAASLRDMIADLRPPALDELGLATALRMLANTRHPGLNIHIEGTERRLESTLELALFRTAQEALNNARRHAAAPHISLRLSYQPRSIVLSVEDDGRGFTPPPDLNTLAMDGHFGLVGIQERLTEYGGTLRVNSTPGSGTRLEASIPTGEREQPGSEVRDPVCSTLLQPEQAFGSAVYNGQTYYFCCPVCRGAFQRDPQAYIPR